MLDAIAFFIEWMIVELCDDFIEECSESWNANSLGFNPGQYTIYEQNILIALDEWLYDFVWYEWGFYINPNGVDMSQYEDAFWGSYDMEVLERAFSDTMYDPYDRMEEILDRAQRLQDALEFLDFF